MHRKYISNLINMGYNVFEIINAQEYLFLINLILYYFALSNEGHYRLILIKSKSNMHYF